MCSPEELDEIHHGFKLLQQAPVDWQNGHVTKSLAAAIDALEIFQRHEERAQSQKDKEEIKKARRGVEGACNLLKGFDGNPNLDVTGELKKHGIDFQSVCPLTDREIDRDTNRKLGLKR